MHVAGRTDRLSELFAESYDRAVDLVKLVLVLKTSLADQKRIVARGLDLKIVVQRGYLL